MRTLRNNPGFPLPLLFDELFSNDFVKFNNTGNVSVNIQKEDSGYAIELIAPGFGKEDFNVNVENNVLTISANVEEDKTEEKKNFTKREFVKQSFSRSFTLPENEIEEDNIKANYSNGILSLALPKKQEALPKAPKTIAIQ